ncbi:MAG: formate--tetrahydrofolate ligase, partial [Bacteroidia bacterium]|nr:formate--tetrahydrofolate ligase [Bacteroidia bacterium]
MAKQLDPTKNADWQIAEAAEENIKKITLIAQEIGLEEEELLPYGHHMGKLDFNKILERLKNKPNGKYVNVTAITPTPLGEGKSTTTIGLVQGLGAIGKKSSAAIRQPSGGPTFNVKGGAAGGGNAQCIPLTDFNLGLTGDIDAITNAHNLAMVALTSRLQHEFNYNDAVLEKKKLKRLNIDPKNLSIKWAIDFSAQALREIITGIGTKMDGFMLKSGFQITVSSELMAILAVAKDLKDFKQRISKMIVAYNKTGDPVTTKDLEVDGAMTAILLKALYPTLVQTIEGQPVLVHAGPFANIAIGQSSIIADFVGLKLSEYHVTESGFGADIGFEKFWNIKCRMSGLVPDCTVLVATIRALKMHGGGPVVKPGKKLDDIYSTENLELVEKGLENLYAHLDVIKHSGVTPVVCLNHFYTDTDKEIELIRKAVEKRGVRFAVSKHWLSGGEGAKELANAVVDACNEEGNFTFFYDSALDTRGKIEKIARVLYGAKHVSFAPSTKKVFDHIDGDTDLKSMGICMAKTHLSLSDNPDLKGRPKDFRLYVRDLLIYQGAGFIVPVIGDIKLMPGTASNPGFRRIDVDVET